MLYGGLDDSEYNEKMVDDEPPVDDGRLAASLQSEEQLSCEPFCVLPAH